MELVLRGRFGIAGDRSVRNAQTDEATLDLATIERCRHHDDEAFGLVVDAYQSRVFGFVRRMVPTGEDAEDVTQEVFLKAYRSFPNFDGRSSLRTWLFRIAHNLCIDRARRRGRTPDPLPLDDTLGDGGYDPQDFGPSPEAIAVTSELRAALESAISEMSEKLRSVLLLHDREEMDYDEISQTLGVPLGTVKSRLFLARKELQRRLKEYIHDRP
ncbi:MAG: hypothetical protein C4320_02620 [Armatimonadota bacterium]